MRTISVSQERTHNYVRQLKGAAMFKALAMFVSFLYVPLMISYLGQERYGVWATLLSILSWVVFFDMGIGNGLRNKVTEALAKGDENETINFIASGYTINGMLIFALWTLLMFATFIIPWAIVFNTETVSEAELRQTVQIAGTFFLLNFWLGLITSVLGAVQRTSVIAFGQLLSNVLAFLMLHLLSMVSDASLSGMAVIYGVSLVVVNLLLNAWFFQRNPKLRPRWLLDRAHLHPLLTQGLQFFTIQLAVLVIFTTDKILITQLFGPALVTPYEVVFKLYSIITFFHTLISAPLWSAYTDAYHRNDLAWIRGMIRKQINIFGGVVLSILSVGIIARPLIGVWIGTDLSVPAILLVLMGVYATISCWNNIFAMFVNGSGQVKIQLFTSIAAMLFNIPLAIFFSLYCGMNTAGIVLATCISLSFSAVALPLQTYCMIRRAPR